MYPLYDRGALEAQLRFVFADKDFQHCKSCNELLKALYSQNIATAFSQMERLLRLCLTVGMTTSSVERSFSRLKNIKTYCRNTMGQQRLSALAKIAIERSLVKDLELRNLHELVVSKFCEKSRRMEFLYK